MVGKIKGVGAIPIVLDSRDETASAEFWQLAKARTNNTRIKQAALDSIDLEPAVDNMGESLTKLRKSSTMNST